MSTYDAAEQPAPTDAMAYGQAMGAQDPSGAYAQAPFSQDPSMMQQGVAAATNPFQAPSY